MPNRIIKESICYSDDIDKLSSFEETVFYRLIVRVDDYGRIDARPSFLRSLLFATKQGVTEKNIKEAVAQMASLGLVRLYEVDGKSFLMFPKWHLHQRLRDSREKYPAPPEDAAGETDSPQVAANRGEPPPESNPNPNPKPNSNPNPESESGRARAREEDLDAFGDSLRSTAEDWLAYKAEKKQPYKPVGRKNLMAEIRNNADRYGDEAVVEVIRQSMGSNYQGIVWDRLKNIAQRGAPQHSKGGKPDTLGVLESMLAEEGGGKT